MGEVGKSAGGKPADFEVAIAATGFGKFNLLILLTVIPPVYAQIFETTALSYVFPIAQCDLGLTLEDKGVLNAITFTGMITSGFLWGYLCDSLGRRKIICSGYFLSGFFSLIASVSQNVGMLIGAKFFTGFIIGGPFAAVTSYLSEFHATQYRARIQLIRGLILTSALILLPLLAWGVLPQKLDLTIHDYFVIHSWNIFLLVCASASITAGIIFMFMPESPKFLMSDGRNEEALKVFQRVYQINTGKPMNTFPITQLIDETMGYQSSSNETKIKQNTKEAIKTALIQIKPLFCAPNISKLVLVCLNCNIMMTSINTLMLWLPQIFQSINDYKIINSNTSPSVCELFQGLITANVTESTTCVVNTDNSSVYINSMIVGVAQVLGFIVAGFFVNLLGKKKLTIIGAFISGCCAISIYFVQNSEALLIFSATFLSLASITGNVLVTITLELFPTTLRAMALSMHMVSARTGAIFGNLLFPILLYAGCAPPFIFTGALAFGCALLCLLYPNTENKALK